MPNITVEDLRAYLDEALSAQGTAEVERALRQSSSLRQILRTIMQERDRGEHTVGAIWRRARLTCASREQLGSYLLGVLDEGLQDYIRFHLEVIGCSYCQANLDDLQAQRREPSDRRQTRRHRLFESSAGLLHKR